MPDFYMGNQNLKSQNVSVKFTKKQLEEYMKCSQDAFYFIEKYVKIVNIDKGFIPIELYPYQKEMISKVVNNRFVISKLPRQSGKTTAIAAVLLWYVLFNENYSIAILAHKAEQSREILGRLQLAYEALPKWLQQGVKEWNKGSLELENGSKIKASSTSGASARGGSYNLIYLDEFAFVPSHIQGTFFASVYPTISSGNTSKVVITSTPNGMELFYKMWTDSVEGRNSYVRIDVGWWDVPNRDEKWKQETIKNTSEQQFRQEFGCEFLGSTNTLIDATVLARIPIMNPIEIRGTDLNIYETPRKEGNYFCMVDTAHGVGGDFSTIVVIDAGSVPYRVVAVYRNNKISPLMFPNMINTVARYFNDAMILVETNDIGQQVVDLLRNELEYENILFTKHMGKNGIAISAGFGGSSVIPGIRMTKAVKKIGCANLKTVIETDKLLVNDFNILHELSVFIDNGVSFEAENGHHDDTVMCLVLFGWLAHQTYFKEMTNIDIRNSLYDENLKMLEEELTPFGIIDDGYDYSDDGVSPLWMER